MNRRLVHLVAVFLTASVVGIATPTAHAGGTGTQGKTRLAGPWYTPHELKALVAYSDASMTRKQALLASGPATHASGASRRLAVGAPRYTPEELKALVAYSNASFAEKRAILAGSTVADPSGGSDFRWSDAGIGAGATLGTLLIIGGMAALIARARKERGRLRRA